MLDSVCFGIVLLCAMQCDRALERYRAAGKLSFRYLKRLLS